ncbi:MAG: ABC transporter permease [Gemmatimonadota bacterium]
MTGINPRHTIASLGRTPTLSAVAVVSVAIAVSLCLLLYSVLQQTLLKPLPYFEPERLVHIMASGSEYCRYCPDGLPAHSLESWKESGLRSLKSVGLYRSAESVLQEPGGEFRRTQTVMVRGELFATLATPAGQGRLLDGNDGVSVAVVSRRFWQRTMASAPITPATVLRIDGRPVQVVGVLSEGSELPADGEVWLNEGEIRFAGSEESPQYFAVGRLAEGVAAEQARSELTSIGVTGLVASGRFRPVAVVAPLREYLNRTSGDALKLLLASAVMSLILAAVNLQTLLLVRAIDHSGQTAIRRALGASDWDIARQILAEGVVLGFGGAVAGLAMAWIGRPLLARYLTSQWSRAVSLPLDWSIAGIAILLATGLAAIVTVAPLLHAWSIDLQASLQQRSASTTTGRRNLRVRASFVVFEVACALILVSASALLIRAYGTKDRVNLGYDASRIAVVPLDLAGTRFDDWSRAASLSRQVIDGLRASGVHASAYWAVTSPGLAVGLNHSWTTIEGGPDPAGSKRLMSAYHVSADFFATIGIPLTIGRPFGAEDREGSAPVVIVNQAAADAWWPGQSPLGRRIKLAPKESIAPWLTVVGIAANTQGIDRRGLWFVSYRSDRTYPAVFVPFAQRAVDLRGGALPLNDLFIGLNTGHAPPGAIPLLQGQVQQAGSGLPPAFATTLEQLQIDNGSYPQILFSGQLLSSLALFSMALAAIGMFGVVAESIRRRTGEIGIRRALGAGGGSIALLVSRPAAVTVLAGIGLGCLLAIGFEGALAHVFFGIGGGNRYGLLLGTSLHDGPALLGAGACFLLSCALGVLLPLRRAWRIEPMEALRHQ